MSTVETLDETLLDEGCVFCRMKFDDDLSSEPTNELLYSGKFHYVISGLGAWVPGYVLLVTNQHFDNFSLAPDETQDEFISLFAEIERLFLAEFGEVTIFEHGAIGDEKQAGGCINHAHVHFVAKNVDLCRDLKQQFRPIAMRNGGSPARHLPRLQDSLSLRQAAGRATPGLSGRAPAPDPIPETKGSLADQHERLLGLQASSVR